MQIDFHGVSGCNIADLSYHFNHTGEMDRAIPVPEFTACVKRISSDKLFSGQIVIKVCFRTCSAAFLLLFSGCCLEIQWLYPSVTPWLKAVFSPPICHGGWKATAQAGADCWLSSLRDVLLI